MTCKSKTKRLYNPPSNIEDLKLFICNRFGELNKKIDYDPHNILIFAKIMPENEQHSIDEPHKTKVSTIKDSFHFDEYSNLTLLSTCNDLKDYYEYLIRLHKESDMTLLTDCPRFVIQFPLPAISSFLQ